MGERGLVRRRRIRRLLTPMVAAITMGAGTLAATAPAAHATTTYVGYACGYYSLTSLFGSNPVLQGCGQDRKQPSTAASPSVTLPSSGSGSTVISGVDNDGALSSNGPAVWFSGPWPVDPNAPAVPSGQLSVSTNGTTVVQAVSQVKGVGPSPFHTGAYGTLDGSVYAKCTASSPTSFTFQTTITGGQVETSTDPVTGDPVTFYDVPSSPAAGLRVDFTLNSTPNGGDHGHFIFNEQITNADGSKTLNAVHEYMEGPNATGDLIIGQVKCGHP